MTQWQKSSFSGPADGSQCVELARDEFHLLLRESDFPDHALTLYPPSPRRPPQEAVDCGPRRMVTGAARCDPECGASGPAVKGAPFGRVGYADSAPLHP
ncbi:hypothetical protein DEJ49_18985 [Streptomyces venezuelae]|uniref:DUF397 domain-containing protein n=1 Tax=Streptomyces venezuelae TaxID=54571 RepID=A0A5P2CJ51_STRVZ|nr:DUF397 domain-containing protein [Streptomyces venezuelae]QES42795.1 hypothetical protein DEJ49_18985 [Streptomyces venezuelae]